MRKSLRFVLLIVLASATIPHARSQHQDGLIDPDPRPRWFKGNLHTHSLWSDGNDYPEMIIDWYARHGYRFLALSDHNVLSQGQKWMSVSQANQRAGEDGFGRYRKRFGESWVETRTVNGELHVRLKPLNEFRSLFERAGSFLLIQGEEITDHFEAKPIHMNASSLLELIKPQGGKSVVETMANNLAAVEAQGRRSGRPILAHLNHPNFGYAITAEELAMVTRERFFEVYNGHPEVHHTGDEAHAGVERMWDIINTLRIGEMGVAPVNGLATDDSHNYFGQRGSSPGRGWIMVRARHLTPESILRAIEARDFYASSGVALRHVGVPAGSGTLGLEIEPHGGARYSTRFIGTLRGYDRTRKPVTGKDGEPLPVTLRYSEDVGRVLATVEGTSPRYRLKGDELYVRAVVTSTEPPENPSFPEQRAQAWTQPVGWETRIAPSNVNSALADEPQVHRDIAYAEPKNERQTLDVYAPGEGKNHPIVFWIHGGGWQVGNKSDVQMKPQAFVNKGFVFVSTNYRFVPNVTIKEMAGDIARSIRWVHDHARDFGGDPDTFFVMGHSAGAQLAALVSTDESYLKAEGLSFSILKGCVPVDGDTYDVPMQIATVEQERKDAYRCKFGDEASQKALSPVTHVARDKGIPTMLILHVADHPETTAQSQRLVKALQEAGSPARAYPAQGKNHGTINADLGESGDEPSKELFEFVDGILAKDKRR